MRCGFLPEHTILFHHAVFDATGRRDQFGTKLCAFTMFGASTARRSQYHAKRVAQRSTSTQTARKNDKNRNHTRTPADSHVLRKITHVLLLQTFSVGDARRYFFLLLHCRSEVAVCVMTLTNCAQIHPSSCLPNKNCGHPANFVLLLPSLPSVVHLCPSLRIRVAFPLYQVQHHLHTLRFRCPVQRKTCKVFVMVLSTSILAPTRRQSHFLTSADLCTERHAYAAQQLVLTKRNGTVRRQNAT